MSRLSTALEIGRFSSFSRSIDLLIVLSGISLLVDGKGFDFFATFDILLSPQGKAILDNSPKCDKRNLNHSRKTLFFSTYYLIVTNRHHAERRWLKSGIQ